MAEGVSGENVEEAGHTEVLSLPGSSSQMDG
jgi:hypothetical protein